VLTIGRRYARTRHTETGPTLNPLRACPESNGSTAQEPQDREHPAVLIARVREIQLREDLAYMALHRLAAQHELLSDVVVNRDGLRFYIVQSWDDYRVEHALYASHLWRRSGG